MRHVMNGRMAPATALLAAALAAACGDDGPSDLEPDAAPPTCETPPTLPPDGDPDGHPAPLAAGPGEARAGRVTGAELPDVPGGYITWRAGDFVLANDQVALVIEDVGDSDLYDPWGGRPVGLAELEGGALVRPNNFGELFLLTGRSTVITEAVTVVSDGSDGGAAIVRARGHLHPLPFFEAVTMALFADDLSDIEVAIDYVLAPDAREVEVRTHYASTRLGDTELTAMLHALMYTKRTPAFAPELGFGEAIDGAPYLALVDDGGTSWAYRLPEPAQSSLSVAGFLGAITGGPTIAGCQVTDAQHASIVIGEGVGLDGVVAAMAEAAGAADRVITGTVTRDGVAAPGVRVHAEAGAAYLTRATTDAAGAFALHVPADADVTLTAFRRGDALVTTEVAAGANTAAIDLPAGGEIEVLATDDGGDPLPVRVQVLPAGGQGVALVPPSFGEAALAEGRLHIDFATTGATTLPVPPGTWEVVVSRGYEYELERQTVDVAAGEHVLVEATMTRSVATPDLVCGDFHVHTSRSNDAADEGHLKVASAVCDGLELPVRSDHELIGSFAEEIEDLGLGAWAAGPGSIEMTTFQYWGHMGVFPVEPDPSLVNAGAPRWQSFPTAAEPDRPFEVLSPPEVFAAVRARPEEPVLIINHPRGSTDYFSYVGYDPVTGMVDDEAAWDTQFTLVEFFNDSGWLANRTQQVEDWLSFLRAGRKVFAVGSSDSHGLASSPVGYPRTCVDLGTDDPSGLTGAEVRDGLTSGRGLVTGGIYVSASVDGAGPGQTASGLGAMAEVEFEVQAATWIDVDAIELIVDGVTVDTIAVGPGDADPGNPVVRYRGSAMIDVRASGDGFVLVAAYGGAPLEPVHPGRVPFGVIQPIFVEP